MASSTRASHLHQHADALSPHPPPHLLTPKTPDRAADDEVRPPATPPRPRLRLKRQNLSQLHAPTQQFLASVAAADFPFPSVEDPPPPPPYASNCHFVHAKLHPRRMATSQPQDEMLTPPHYPRQAIHSPPTTPTPSHASIPSLSPFHCYPDWSRDASGSSSDSSSECESSRPSTAYSTLTDASLFSRLSQATENSSRCGSLDAEFMSLDASAFAPAAAKTLTAPVPLARRRKAPWTKAMSKHLWSIYILYMQDPHVTPFRVGRNGILPAGVCMRVAAEAKRSWKGSRAQEMESKVKTSPERESTPTIDNTRPSFIEWPHTGAATRAHLRDLCRATTANPTLRERRRLPLTPTPLGKPASRFCFWGPRSLDPPQASASAAAFSGNDLAMSLAVCTSPSMQPDGPLARITGSRSEPSFARARLAGSPTAMQSPVLADRQPDAARSPALLSAQTYGPSCSSAPAAQEAAPAAVRPRRSHTLGTRRSLGSPVRLSESRTGTQKRRSQKPEAEPRKSKRPSLGSDFWVYPTAPMSNSRHLLDTTTVTPEFCSTSLNLRDRLFVPRSAAQKRIGGISLPPLIHVTHKPPDEGDGGAKAAAAASTRGFHARPRPFTAELPRLGSPFCANNPSLSMPNRHLDPELLGISNLRRPFRTLHESVDTSTTAAKRSLADRLALIDEHLKAFRRRDTNDRRSHSPFS